MGFSKCMDIINEMAQEDVDTLLEKLDQYIAMGVPPEKAQRMAASDTLEEIRAESAEFIRLVQEQHPDPEPGEQKNERNEGQDDAKPTNAFDDRPGNAGAPVAGPAGRGDSGGPAVSAEGRAPVAAGFSGGPGQPAGAAAQYSQRANQPDDARTIAGLEAALGRFQQPSLQADPAQADTQALNALLGAFAKLTGTRGIALDWKDGPYGLQYGPDFFVNVSDPDLHVAQTIGHEFKHISEKFPGLNGLYNQLWALVGESGQAEYFQYLKRSKQVKSESLETATAREMQLLKDEMLADFMGERFNDKAWLQELAIEQPRLFGEFVRDWIKLLGELITSLRGTVSDVAAVKNVDRYITQLARAKALAKEVAIVWAKQNPNLVARSRIREEVPEIEVGLTWTAKPGATTGLMPRMAVNGGAQAQREHLTALKQVLAEHGPERMMWGTSRFREVLSTSGWRGITAYAVQSSLKLLGGKLTARTKNEIEFFLASRGLWLAQDAMAWHAPKFGKQGQGVEFNLGGEPLADQEFEELYAAVRHEFNDHSVTPIASKDGVRFVNTTGLSQVEFDQRLKTAIAKTSVYQIWDEANENENNARGSSKTGSQDERGNSPLRTRPSDLPGGRDDDRNAFSAEGIRTFDLDGGTLTNDWRQGEGQYRERVIKAWAALQGLPVNRLPKTLEDLNAYLDDVQRRVDEVNAKFARAYLWQKASLTAQERATGIKDSFDYPAGQIDSEKAAKAYFKHPDGTLQTLFHGSITTFEAARAGRGEHSKTGAVFYASTSPVYAGDRAETMADAFPRKAKKTGANVMPVYVLASNPFDWRILAHRDAVMAHLPDASDDLVAALEEGEYATIESKEVLTAAKKAGFDSFLTRDEAEDVGYVGIGLFNADDVVFAMGASGQPLDASVKYSARVNEGDRNAKDAPGQRKRNIVGRTTRVYTPAQLKAFANVGFEVEVPSLADRARALWKDAGKKLAQGLVDQFAPIKEIDPRAYGLLRLAKGAAGAFETLLRGGKLKLNDDVYDFDETQKGGVVDQLLTPMQGEHHDFLRWVAANRAEGLMQEGKEHLFTPDDIDAIKSLADGHLAFAYTLKHGRNAGEVTRNRKAMYQDSLVTFNGFNENVLDMAEQSGLIAPEARAMWTSEFYVPFHRVMEEGSGMHMGGGAVRQKALKTLKGGTSALNADLLDSTLMNWAHLLDASAKNRAAKAALEAAEDAGVAISADEATARQMGKATDNKNGVVWFLDEGQPRYFLVDDPFVMTAITSLQYAGMRNPVMNALGAAKHLMTVGVTASPFFKIRNLIRDSVQVIGTSAIGVNPLKNVADGWRLTNPENDLYFRLLAGGGVINFGTMVEGSEAKRVQALVESGVDVSTILGDEHKLKAFFRKYIEPGITAYNELGNRGEAVNRAALYDQLVRQGVSHADASLQARDLMDFSMQGTFTTIRFLNQVLPFFNARLQGAYKLGRAAKEDPKRMAYVTGAVALASLSLLALYGDDDDWRKREDWDRNNYWWFKFGGTAFRIPKPFEIGAIGTLAERSAELLFDDEMTGTRFRNQVLTLLADNMSMSLTPQLVRPMLDVYANKDGFTGRPIETLGMERLQADYRFNNRTTMTARAVSTSLNAVTGLVGKESLSPVQADYLIRGYFGWLGTFIVAAPDMAARYATDQPVRPSSDLWKTATGGIVAQLEGAPSRYVSQVYEQATVLEQAYATYRTLLKEGKAEEARGFLADNLKEINSHRNLAAIRGAIARINQQIRAVEASNRDAMAKRVEVNRLSELRDRFARRLKAV